MAQYTRGSTYELRVKIKSNGQPIDNNVVSAIEFTIGDVRKLYPEDVEYDSQDQSYVVHLTQEDTFKFDRVEQSQARVKFADGSVCATRISTDNIAQSLSEVVL